MLDVVGQEDHSGARSPDDRNRKWRHPVFQRLEEIFFSEEDVEGRWFASWSRKCFYVVSVTRWNEVAALLPVLGFRFRKFFKPSSAWYL